MITLEEIKAKNTTLFAYCDREIDLVNNARNHKSGYTYWKHNNTYTQTLQNTGDDKKIGNHTIIELPACALNQSSPIEGSLRKSLKNLQEYTNILGNRNPYPVKILFPYKLQSWHWNVGEIIIDKLESGEYKISGYAIDSINPKSKLEDAIQKEIKDVFDDYNGIYKNADFSLDSILKDLKVVQIRNIACGVYAGIAMHSLKSSNNPWEVIGNKKDQELRDEDSKLISECSIETSAKTFCASINDPWFDYDDNALTPAEKESIRELDAKFKNLNNTDLQIIQKAIIKYKLLDNTEDMSSSLNKFFFNLENLNLQKIFFIINANNTRDALIYEENVVRNIGLNLAHDKKTENDLFQKGLNFKTNSCLQKNENKLEKKEGKFKEEISNFKTVPSAITRIQSLVTLVAYNAESIKPKDEDLGVDKIYASSTSNGNAKTDDNTVNNKNPAIEIMRDALIISTNCYFPRQEKEIINLMYDIYNSTANDNEMTGMRHSWQGSETGQEIRLMLYNSKNN
jgi:hypothetical protein